MPELPEAETQRRSLRPLRGRAALRAILTDQDRIAGIGNLWAHELLHAARLRPDRSARSLTARSGGRPSLYCPGCQR